MKYIHEPRFIDSNDDIRGLAAAIKRAKGASDVQNEQSRRISEELRQERERDVIAPKVLHGQMTFSDFMSPTTQ